MKPSRAFSRRHVLAGAAGTLFAPAIITRASAATRGVSDTEVIIGTMTDLSGVTAVQGVNNANAIRMAFDDANAKGGIHGRKIRYIVEDNEYMVPKGGAGDEQAAEPRQHLLCPGERRHADERCRHADRCSRRTCPTSSR